MGAEAAALLARAQRAAGISQHEWARRTGVAQPQIHRYLRGTADPSVGQLSRLLAAAGQRITIRNASARDVVTDRRISRELLEVMSLADFLPRGAPGAMSARPFRELVAHD